MADEIVQRFIRALGQLEARRELEPLLALFGDDAACGNVLMEDELRGREGVRSFWHIYRETFGDVKSTFRVALRSNTHAALEWRSEGTSRTGGPVSYRGVSMLDIEGDRITRFMAYFDPACLGRQLATSGLKAAAKQGDLLGAQD